MYLTMCPSVSVYKCNCKPYESMTVDEEGWVFPPIWDIYWGREGLRGIGLGVERVPRRMVACGFGGLSNGGTGRLAGEREGLEKEGEGWSGDVLRCTQSCRKVLS